MSFQRIFKLKGVVQHYSWGGYDFIPQLINIDNKEHKPFAEYWLGAHPNHPAIIENGQGMQLNDFISIEGERVLGKKLAEKFSLLPFLLKILDVRQMLSIQVHPSMKSAKKGFKEENEKGIPVNASHRNYKDENHKPELMVALSDFYLLHGFKEEQQLLSVLNAKPEFKFLVETFLVKSYQGLYEKVMTMEQKTVNEILTPLLKKIVPLYEANKLRKNSEDFWAARAALNFCKDDNYDRGIFSIYFFNLLHLKKDEGIFQPACLPHAYLEGQNVEVMANSDNVLRAGLTDKHIDVAELMKHVKFEATIPNILRYRSDEITFASPAEEFELSKFELRSNHAKSFSTRTAEIFLVMKGNLKVVEENHFLEISKGEAFFVPAATLFKIEANENAGIFRVTAPCE